jgi:hypothetical protein
MEEENRKRKKGDGRPIITLKSKKKGIDRKRRKNEVAKQLCPFLMPLQLLAVYLALFMASPSIGASLGRHTNPSRSCCLSGQRYATELGSVGVVLAFCSWAIESVVFIFLTLSL